MLIITQTGRILYISENAAEYLGHSMVIIIGQCRVPGRTTVTLIVSGGLVDPRRQHLRHRGQAGPSHPDGPPPDGY